MRYRPEHKEETHQRIVGTASREFREKGFEGVGIATLMKKQELTHGGFYAHFETKDHLIQEAIARAFDEVDERIQDVLEKQGVVGLIELYLSPGHVENSGIGCPVPALASEVSRQHEESALLFAERLKHRIQMLADEVPGESATVRLDLATFLFSSMVGAVVTARSTSDPFEKQKILETTRNRLLKMI